MTKNYYEPTVATSYQPEVKYFLGKRTDTNKGPSAASKPHSIAVTDTNTCRSKFSKQKRMKSIPFVQSKRILHHNLQGSPRGSHGHLLQRQSYLRATKPNSRNYETCGKKAKQPRTKAHPQDVTTTHRSLEHNACVVGENPNHAQPENILVDIENYDSYE